MAHLMLVERMKESVRSEQMVASQTGRPAPDLQESLDLLDQLIYNDESMVPTISTEEQRRRAEHEALRVAVGLPPRRS